MKPQKDNRRRFLKRGAAMAGVAVGALRPASAQGGMSPDSVSPGKHLPYGGRSRYETTERDYSKGGGQYQMSGSAGTPLEDLHGIITPSSLHFVISHGATPPDFDPKEHRLLIQGMVDRPLIFSLEELKRLPSISRRQQLLSTLFRAISQWNGASNAHGIARANQLQRMDRGAALSPTSRGRHARRSPLADRGRSRRGLDDQHPVRAICRGHGGLRPER